MGRMGTLSMLETADDMGFDRMGVLEWHVLHNHFPQPPRSVVKIAEKAIELANDGEWSTLIKFKDFDPLFGDRCMSVDDIITKLHLEDFLEEDDYESVYE